MTLVQTLFFFLIMVTTNSFLEKTDAATGSRQSVGLIQGKLSGEVDSTSKNYRADDLSSPSSCERRDLRRTSRFILPQAMKTLPSEFKKAAIAAVHGNRLRGNGRKSQGSPTKVADDVFAEMCKRMEAHQDFKLKEIIYEANGRDYKITRNPAKTKVEIMADIDYIAVGDVQFDFSYNQQYDTIVELVRTLQNKNFFCVGRTILEEHAHFSLKKSKPSISQTTHLEVQSSTEDYLIIQSDDHDEESPHVIRDMINQIETFAETMPENLKAYTPQIANLMVFVYQLYRSRNTADIVVSVYSFCQNKAFPYSYADIKSLVAYFLDTVTPQGGWLDSVESALKGESRTRIMSLINCIIAIFASSKIGSIKDLFFYKSFIKSHEAKLLIFGPDFILLVLQNLQYLYDRLVQAYADNSFATFFHSSDTYTDHFDLCSQCLRREPFLGNCEAHGFSDHEYICDIEKCITRGEEIIKRLTLLRHDKLNQVKIMHGNMQSLKMRIMTSELASQTRDMPFSLLIFGNTSIGKSSLVDATFQFFAQAHPENLKATDEFRYDRNPNDPFWVNFKSKCWFIHIDDAACLLPQPGQPDLSIQEGMMINNCMPACPTQAALEDKGMTPLRNKLTITTTNVKDLNLWSYFQFPSAAARRYPFVLTPKVKKEFQTPDGALDSVKAQEWTATHPQCTFPDWWTFDLDTVVPGKAVNDDGVVKGRVMFKYRNIFKNATLSEFLPWYYKAINEHHSKVLGMRLSRRRMRDMTICKYQKEDGSICCLTNGMCGHIQEQVLEEVHNRVAPVMRQYAEEIIEYAPDKSNDSVIVWALDDYGNTLLSTALRAAQIGDIYTKGIATSIGGFFLSPVAYISIVTSEILLYSSTMTLCYFIYSQMLLFFFIYCMFCALRDKIKLLHIKLNYYIDTARKINSMRHKDFWIDLGKSVYESYKVPLAVASMLSVLIILYKLRKSTTSLKAQSDSDTDDSISSENHAEKALERPTLSCPRNQPESKWAKDNVGIAPLDVGRLSLSWNRYSTPDIIDKIQRNFYRCTAQYTIGSQGKRTHCSLVCVTSQYYIGNKHCFQALLTGETNVIRITIQNINDKVPFVIHLTHENFRCHDELDDIVIIYSRNFNRHRSLMELIPTKDFLKSKGNGSLNLIEENKQTQIPLKALRICDLSSMTQNLNRTIHGNNFWVAEAPTDGRNGWCGSPMFLETGYGTSLVGIHSLGGTIENVTSLCSTPLIRHKITETISKFEHSELMVQSGDSTTQNSAIVQSFGRISHIDFLEDENKFNFLYLGQTKFRSSFKSQVQHTPLKEEIECAFNRQLTVTKPIGTYEPFNIGLRQHINGATVPEYLMKEACDDYISTIKQRLGTSKVAYITPLNLKENVNGIPGCLYIDSINRKSSTGFPYNTSKKDYLVNIPPCEIYQDPVMPNEQILSDYNYIMSCYKRGERAYVVFRASVKDQAISFEKAKIGKIRLFSGSPFAFTLIVREYFLPITKFLQENRLSCEMAVGIVNDSLEWTQLAKHMLKKSHHFGGDFKGYDKGMQASSIHLGMETLIEIGRIYGNYSNEDIRIMYCIAADLSKAYIDFDGDVFSFQNGNHSGHALTVIINCVVHAAYMRVVYKQLHPEGSMVTFRDTVTLVTYGDDGMIGVDKKFAPFFTFASVSAALKNFNIGYTMPDKSANVVEYIPFDKLSFLKRIFVWDAENQYYKAPLEKESIFNSMMIHIPSKSVPLEHQLSDTIHSACLEMIPYGKLEYSDFINKIRPIMKRHEIPERKHMFLSYEFELANLFKRKAHLMTDFHHQYVKLHYVAPEENKSLSGHLEVQSLEEIIDSTIAPAANYTMSMWGSTPQEIEVRIFIARTFAYIFCLLFDFYFLFGRGTRVSLYALLILDCIARALFVAIFGQVNVVFATIFELLWFKFTISLVLNELEIVRARNCKSHRASALQRLLGRLN